MKFSLLCLLALSLSACSIIGPGERGVRYYRGKVSDEIMQPGTHLWIPFFMGSQTLNVMIYSLGATTSSGTKDQQEVTTTVTVNLQIDPDKVVSIVREVGTDDGLLTRVSPLIQEAVNGTISKFNAEEILTKRSEVKAEIEKLIRERITKYGVIIHDIALKDMQYSKEYAQAIERKQVAEQAAKQAEYETLKAKQEALAAVETAKGEAQSNALKQSALTDKLIQYEAIQKWDGKLPQFSGSGPVPFINVK